MPNWCVNQVDIRGDEAEVAKLVEFVKTDECAFDFRKIVPPPDTDRYRGTSSSNTFICGCATESRVIGKFEDGTDKYGWFIGDVEVLFDGKCPIHGKPNTMNDPENWYQWNIANWGSKWDAAEVWNERLDDSTAKVDGQTSYNFDTAWSPAEPVVAALAEQFPTLSITHRYCEAGMGYAGEVLYADGVETRREEYDMGDPVEGAFYGEDAEGHVSWARNYDKVPMNSMERFCNEHFGGVVGG
jgi:hypothetical protein